MSHFGRISFGLLVPWVRIYCTKLSATWNYTLQGYGNVFLKYELWKYKVVKQEKSPTPASMLVGF